MSWPDGTAKPTPRRLHFDTIYDQQAYGNMQAHQALGTMLQPAQAMNTSPQAGIPLTIDTSPVTAVANLEDAEADEQPLEWTTSEPRAAGEAQGLATRQNGALSASTLGEKYIHTCMHAYIHTWLRL